MPSDLFAHYRQAQRLVGDFRRLVRARELPARAPWLRAAEATALPELRAFAATPRHDQAAIEAALTEAWSSGPVEGQVTRLKLIKRQGYGRAKLDLLRRRVRRAA